MGANIDVRRMLLYGAMPSAALGTALGATINDLAGALIGAAVAVGSLLVFALQWHTIDACRTERSRAIHAVALAASVLVLVAMGEIAGLLDFMRPSGAPARGIGFLTTTADDTALLEAIEGYQDFEQRSPETRGARAVVWLFVALDSVLFVWAYGMLFARVIRRRLEQGGRNRTRAVGKPRTLIVAAERALIVLLIVDWVENLLIGALVEEAWNRSDARTLTTILMAATTGAFAIKWAAVALAAVAVVVARLMTRQPFFGTGDATIREAAKRLRPLTVVYAVLFVALFQPLQVSDMLLVLGDLGSPLWFTLLALVVLAVTMWTWARFLQVSQPAMRELCDDREMIKWGLALTVVGLVLLVVDWHWIVLLPGIATLAIAVAGLLLKPDDAGLAKVPEGAERDEIVGASYLPALLGGGVMVLVGTAMVRTAAADAYFIDSPSAARRLLWIGLVVFIAGGALPFALRKALALGGPGLTAVTDRLSGREHGRAARFMLGVSVGAAGISLVWVALDPIGAGRSLGALALVLVFLSLAASLSALLVRSADRLRPPTLFELFGIRRIPVFALFAAWFVIAQFVLPRDDHDVRAAIELEPATVVAGCDSVPTVTPSIDDAFGWWLATNGLTLPDDAPAVAPADRTKYPMVFIAASGGGVRAAWWGAAVMGKLVPEAGPGCLDAPLGGFDGRQVFVASGISGGSLGLATHQAAILAGVDIDNRAQWVDQRLGVDHLSPALAWLTYIEFPRSMLGFPYGDDRAAVMEESWEETWGETPGLELGLGAAWSRSPQLPLLALNGASVDDGCRVLASVLDVNGDPSNCSTPTADPTLAETQAITDFICDGTDLRLSTAALLSARFPLISPAGRLVTCDGEHSIEVVDGGYRDANGAETAVDVLRQVEPMIDDYNADPIATRCIEPVYVFIEDDFRLPAPPAPSELWPLLLAPAEAILAAQGSAAGEADITIRTEIDDDHRYHIAPTAAPGSHPALGWSLSTTTLRKMEEQLVANTEIVKLRAEMAELQSQPCE